MKRILLLFLIALPIAGAGYYLFLYQEQPEFKPLSPEEAARRNGLMSPDSDLLATDASSQNPHDPTRPVTESPDGSVVQPAPSATDQPATGGTGSVPPIDASAPELPASDAPPMENPPVGSVPSDVQPVDPVQTPSNEILPADPLASVDLPPSPEGVQPVVPVDSTIPQDAIAQASPEIVPQDPALAAPVDPIAAQDIPVGNIPADIAPMDMGAATSFPDQKDLSAATAAPLPAAAYVPFDGTNPMTLNSDFPSMLFSQGQTELLYSRIKRFKDTGGNPASIIARQPTDEMQAGEVITDPATVNNIVPDVYSPSFYLGSVLYPKDNNWTVWLNSQKIRKEDHNGIQNITVRSISEDSGVFLYNIGQEELDKLAPNYKYNLLRASDHPNAANLIDETFAWDYASPDGNIRVASAQGIVEFRLNLRQTFSLYDMSVKEGYVAPVKISSGSEMAAEITGTGDATLDQIMEVTGANGQQQEQTLDILDPNAAVPATPGVTPAANSAEGATNSTAPVTTPAQAVPSAAAPAPTPVPAPGLPVQP